MEKTQPGSLRAEAAMPGAAPAQGRGRACECVYITGTRVCRQAHVQPPRWSPHPGAMPALAVFSLFHCPLGLLPLSPRSSLTCPGLSSGHLGGMGRWSVGHHGAEWSAGRKGLQVRRGSLSGIRHRRAPAVTVQVGVDSLPSRTVRSTENWLSC